jgi:hypothetical protein
MGLIEEFDDRQTQALAESDEYHPYEYQTENNTSWAGALPVKQYVVPLALFLLMFARHLTDLSIGVCMILTLRKMLAV